MATFDFSSEYILEDEVVQLRPLKIDDFEHFREFAKSEPELWRYSLMPVAGEGNMLQYIEMALAARDNHKEYPFAVFDKQKQKYAGSTRFYDIQLPNKTLQLGYTWYGKEFQGTGLNKHCKYLMLSFAFETLGLERVEFRADNTNQRSIAAMKSIGCTVEGVLRSNMPIYDGGRRDSIILSILKEEWFEEKKEALLKKL